jgi:predicted nucleotidyltransferase
MGSIIPNMGIKTATSIGDALFTRTQRQVLSLLFGNPTRSYYSNEIMRLAGAGIGAVHRELKRLESVGLITAKRFGNQKHYQANQESPIFEELRGIVVKTFGVADRVREALESLRAQISAAFIYGSVASNTDSAYSDIDLMLIGDELTYQDVIQALMNVEQELGRPVNPVVMGQDEWHRKMDEAGGFVKRVMDKPKIFLIGSENDIS